MCGIAGVYEHANRRDADEHGVRSMLASIIHRGPDDEGIHREPGVAIGSRRLSIIDVDGGHQPIASEDGSVVVVLNGEIYNYRELRERLQAGGHVLRTGSDTEVIVHLYEELGERCVEELRGMFAFAVWDARRRSLLLARDRLGIKPLYYSEENGRLLFGSEIKALLRYPGTVARANLHGLAAFLLLKYVPAPETMFSGIAALPPGHTLVCDGSGVRIRRWWDLSFRPASPPLSEGEAAERLAVLLRDAVRSHLVSDVPFGAFLSGGVDSSTVVALMSQILTEPVKTFAVGFAGIGEELSELPFARIVAERYGTDHEEVLVGASDLVALAEKIVWHLDQPIADDACLATHLVANLASGSVKMVLTGEGGDELFGGYARYAGERLAPAFGRLPPWGRAAGAALSRRGRGLRRPRLALYALCQPEERRRLASWFSLMHPDARAELADGALADELAAASPESLFAAELERTDATEPINRMLYVDTKLWLPDDLLARGDKMSMAASLEARMPLLDHQLVEFAASLPPDLKVRGLKRKYLLKQVASQWLPDEIINRRKQGFPIPISQWLRGEAREFCHDLLAPDAVSRHGYFDPAVVQSLLRDHDTGAADHGSTLWALISVELWHRLYLGEHTRHDLDAPARTSV